MPPVTDLPPACGTGTTYPDSPNAPRRSLLCGSRPDDITSASRMVGTTRALAARPMKPMTSPRQLGGLPVLCLLALGLARALAEGPAVPADLTTPPLDPSRTPIVPLVVLASPA